MNIAQKRRAGIGPNIAQRARAAGITGEAQRQRLQHQQHVHELERTASAAHPWNKPGLSYRQKMDLRDTHLRHKATVSWRHVGLADSSDYQAAADYASANLPPPIARALNSFVDPSTAGDSGAPRVRDNLLLLGAAGVVAWFYLHRKKR